uniref:Uncharacterized protein n=1 Tax=Monodelphis domestica TaxID=13616 RepID=K7E254_MONDO
MGALQRRGLRVGCGGGSGPGSGGSRGDSGGGGRGRAGPGRAGGRAMAKSRGENGPRSPGPDGSLSGTRESLAPGPDAASAADELSSLGSDSEANGFAERRTDKFGFLVGAQGDPGSLHSPGCLLPVRLPGGLGPREHLEQLWMPEAISVLPPAPSHPWGGPASIEQTSHVLWPGRNTC